MVGLPRLRPGSPPALLVAPDPRLQSPLPRGWPPSSGSASRGSTSPADRSAPGTSSRPTATGASCGGRSRRSSASCGRCSSAAPKASVTSSSAASRRTRSSSGRDLHRDRRRRAHQRPSRARPARRRHPSQALARQPVRARRAHHRAAAPGRTDLPATAPITVCLPHRGARRERPRRPHSVAPMSEQSGGTERLPEVVRLQAFCGPMTDRSTACHAEGRGFESLQPLPKRLAFAGLFCVAVE
jgi:hypothetical protein